MKRTIDERTETADLLSAMAEIAKILKTRFRKRAHTTAVGTIIDNVNFLSRVESARNVKAGAIR